MALYDIASKTAGKPLYAFLGGAIKEIETDLTIGIGSPSVMAQQAAVFVNKGVRIIKVKLGKKAEEDIERVKLIRQAVGTSIKIRIDANQGWNFDDAVQVLSAIAKYDIEFCEQPMRYWDDHHLPQLRKQSPIKIMADESVYDHRDAQRIIDAESCDYVNIKFAKSGGIREAIKIHDTCKKHDIPCMMGGMLESRIALTAFAHFAMANDNIIFYDMDTCMLGHKEDPVTGGVKYNGYFIETPSMPGIGADADESFLKKCESITI
jgi:L-alanine-DL-glutamate epimerase-like enolase superfamily enzyme